VFEIILLIVAGSTIAAYARARGGNPWFWGSLAMGGYFVLAYVAPVFLRVSPDSDARIWTLGAALAWVGVVAFCARFLLGAGAKKPSGMWTCPNCKYLNQHYAVICEACKHPYGQPAPAA
jgi:hypothetical protein